MMHHGYYRLVNESIISMVKCFALPVSAVYIASLSVHHHCQVWLLEHCKYDENICLLQYLIYIYMVDIYIGMLDATFV